MTDIMLRGLRKEDVKSYEVKDSPIGKGTQVIFEFVNGYGASVVRFGIPAMGGIIAGSYGAAANKWELAVLRNGQIDYSTPITDDVIGYLDESEVVPLLAQIATLDPVIPLQIEG